MRAQKSDGDVHMTDIGSAVEGLNKAVAAGAVRGVVSSTEVLALLKHVVDLFGQLLVAPSRRLALGASRAAPTGPWPVFNPTDAEDSRERATVAAIQSAPSPETVVDVVG